MWFKYTLVCDDDGKALIFNTACTGVIGLGGLGTMGIKLAKALGHRAVAISTSSSKKEQFKFWLHKFKSIQ